MLFYPKVAMQRFETVVSQAAVQSSNEHGKQERASSKVVERGSEMDRSEVPSWLGKKGGSHLKLSVRLRSRRERSTSQKQGYSSKSECARSGLPVGIGSRGLLFLSFVSE